MLHQKLDTSGLLCPIPVIKTQESVQKMKPGEQLLVICTDPGCLEDIPAWCRIHGHHVLEMLEKENRIEILIAVR